VISQSVELALIAQLVASVDSA